MRKVTWEEIIELDPSDELKKELGALFKGEVAVPVVTIAYADIPDIDKIAVLMAFVDKKAAFSVARRFAESILIISTPDCGEDLRVLLKKAQSFVDGTAHNVDHLVDEQQRLVDVAYADKTCYDDYCAIWPVIEALSVARLGYPDGLIDSKKLTSRRKEEVVMLKGALYAEVE